MSEIETGGPAFPVPGLQNDADFNGMTLRDYIAATSNLDFDGFSIAFAESILGSKMPMYTTDPLKNAIFWAEFRSTMRYIEADAMLMARMK